MPGSGPTFSVVLPCYNQGGFIEQALASVAIATEAAHEAIVVNDGSTERSTQRTLMKLRASAPHQQLVLLEQPNLGLSAARNAGIDAARGTWIKFLDADDLILRSGLDQQRHQLLKHSRTPEAYPTHRVGLCDYLTLVEETLSVGEPAIQPSAWNSFNFEAFALRWERGLTVPIHCGLFHRTLFTEGLRFDGAIRQNREDWLFWLELSNMDVEFDTLNQSLVVYRLHSSSMTRSGGRSQAEAWLHASAIAAQRYPERFTAKCVDKANLHFKRHYMRQLWREHGPALPWAVYRGFASDA